MFRDVGNPFSWMVVWLQISDEIVEFTSPFPHHLHLASPSTDVLSLCIQLDQMISPHDACHSITQTNEKHSHH